MSRCVPILAPPVLSLGSVNFLRRLSSPKGSPKVYKCPENLALGRWSLVSGHLAIWSLASGHLVSGLWSLVSGVWCLVILSLVVWSLVSGLWSLVIWSRSSSSSLPSSTSLTTTTATMTPSTTVTTATCAFANRLKAGVSGRTQQQMRTRVDG